MHVGYLEHDYRLTRMFKTLCDLAQARCTVYRDEAALTAALASPAGPDVIAIDCSAAEPAETTACARIVTATQGRAILIHPQERFVRLLESVAPGRLTWLAPDFGVLSGLQLLRSLSNGNGPAAAQRASAPIGTDALVQSVSEEILTPREEEVLALIRLGCTDREIASCLGVSSNTVKTHAEHLKQKLNVGKRRDLVRSA